MIKGILAFSPLTIAAGRPGLTFAGIPGPFSFLAESVGN
jgi:hypothetical protein